MKFLTLIGAIALLSFSCSSSSSPDEPSGPSLAFQASINQQAIDQESWNASHAAGVFVTRAGGNWSEAGAVLHTNTKVTPSAEGLFTLPSDPGGSGNASKGVDVIAYLPYRSVEADHQLPINLTQQNDQAALTLLYSNNIKAAVPKQHPLQLDFSLPLVKMVVQFAEEKGGQAPWQITLDGAATEASFDLRSGAIKPKEHSAASLSFKTTTTEHFRYAEAILLPSTNTASLVLSVHSGTTTQKIALKDHFRELEGGKMYILSWDAAESFPTDIRSSIRPWREIPTNAAPAWRVGDDFRLVWSEEFSGAKLDETVWNIERVDNPQNNEYQAYLAENVNVGKEPISLRSCLILTAKKEDYKNRYFTSGRINSMKKVAFQYGRIDARIMLPPTANGLWPAFWMKGNDNDVVAWPACGEIDIMEMGHRDGMAAGTADRFIGMASHWGPNNAGLRSESVKNTLPYSLQDGKFHTYTLVWDKDFIAMYVDLDAFPQQAPLYRFAHRTNSNNAVTYFNKPFYILFNLAVGGNYTGITGNANLDQITGLNEANNHAARMYVDYVRIYQKGESNEKLIKP